jgi:hypothetical protein
VFSCSQAARNKTAAEARAAINLCFPLAGPAPQCRRVVFSGQLTGKRNASVDTTADRLSILFVRIGLRF